MCMYMYMYMYMYAYLFIYVCACECVYRTTSFLVLGFRSRVPSYDLCN